MPRLTGIALGDEPTVLSALGLTVDAAGCATVGGVTLQATGEAPGDGIVGLDLDAPTPGLPVRRVPDGAAADHPLGAVAVDHVVVLAGDVAGAIAAAGLEARRTEVRGDRRYAYVVVGTALLEFVGPSEPDDRPPRPWGLALSVADLDAAVGLLAPHCGAPKDAVQPGRRIATVRHEALGASVPTVLLTPR